MHNFRHKFKELKLKCLKKTSDFMEKAFWSGEVIYDKNTKQRVVIVGIRDVGITDSCEYHVQPLIVVGMNNGCTAPYSISLIHAGGRFKKIIRC